MDNNFGQDKKNDTDNENDFDKDKKDERPWFLKPSVVVNKEYNPYRDGETVFEETIKKIPGAFIGSAPLPNERREYFYYRKNIEMNIARTEAQKGLRRSSCYIAVIILLYLFLTNFIALLTVFSFDLNGYINVDTVVTIIQYVFIAPAVIIIANIGQKHKVFNLFKKPEVSGFFIFKWCVISIGATYLVSFVGDIIFEVIQLFGIYVNDLVSPLPSTPTNLLIYFFAVVIGAPLFEEILFRGIFLTHHLKYGSWHAITVTGLLFGLLHQNHQQIIYATALGLLFGYIAVKSGSLIPSIVAHMSVNLYSFLITLSLYFTNYNDVLEGNAYSIDGPVAALLISGILNSLVYLLMLAAIVLFVLEIVFNKKEFVLPKGDSFLTSAEKRTAFFGSVAMIIVLVLLGISIMLNSFIDIEAILQMIT